MLSFIKNNMLIICILIEVIKGIIFTIVPGEADFHCYMQQAKLIVEGERDYTKIDSENGIMCYPAIHAWIYNIFWSDVNKNWDKY